MNNLINLKNKSLFLFIFLFIYYFISPYIFLFDNFISRANIFIGEVDYINNSNKLIFFIYNTLSIIFLFLFLLSYVKFY